MIYASLENSWDFWIAAGIGIAVLLLIDVAEHAVRRRRSGR